MKMTSVCLRRVAFHKLFLWIWCLVFLALTALPRTSSAESGIIWSIEAPLNTVYLLGSLHVLKPESYPLPESVENLYKCCERIVFETDMGQESTAELQALMMNVGRYPSGQGLSRNISNDTYHMLQSRASDAGADIRLFEKYRPWFVAIAIAGVEFQRLGFDPGIGIDRHFFKRAVQDNKKLVFLETNQYQLGLFSGLNARKQEELLRQMLNEVDVINSEFAAMIDAWKKGDAEALGRTIREGFRGFPGIYKRFIVNRNRRWVPKIEKLMRQRGDVLIIVGAAHLTGDDSVIKMLRQKGYKVEKY